MPDGILLEITQQRCRYWQRHNVQPDTIHLGRKEYRRLKARLRELLPNVPAETDEQHLYGMRISLVDAYSWLHVNYVGE